MRSWHFQHIHLQVCTILENLKNEKPQILDKLEDCIRSISEEFFMFQIDRSLGFFKQESITHVHLTEETLYSIWRNSP